MNKKAVSLPINFVVILIITIILFAISLYFLGIIGGGVQTISEELDRRTADQIEYLIKSENAIVALPFGVQEADLGDCPVFGMGIQNIAGEDEFGVIVRFDAAYTLDGRPILGASADFIDENWVGTSSQSEPITISANQYEPFGFVTCADDRISQTENTQPGEYVFNVCVFKMSGGTPSCVLESIATESTLLYPPGKIHQATIRVNS
jgi:hypothetical protein